MGRRPTPQRRQRRFRCRISRWVRQSSLEAGAGLERTRCRLPRRGGRLPSGAADSGADENDLAKAWPQSSLFASVQLDDLLAAVGWVADQPLTDRIDHEIERMQRYPPDSHG